MNRSRGKKHGETQWQQDHWKAVDARTGAWKRGQGTFEIRWQEDEKYRNSQQAHGWKEEYYRCLDCLTTIDISYTAPWHQRHRYESTIAWHATMRIIPRTIACFTEHFLGVPDSFSSFCSSPPQTTPTSRPLTGIRSTPCATSPEGMQSGHLAEPLPHTHLLMNIITRMRSRSRQWHAHTGSASKRHRIATPFRLHLECRNHEMNVMKYGCAAMHVTE